MEYPGLNRLPIIILLLSIVFLAACGEEESLTGKAVYQPSTLTIIVQNENGTTMEQAEVFLNGKFKGLTSKYGASKGTKKVVLEGPDNLIWVVKQGFAKSEPISISENPRGEQRIVFVLERLKTGLYVTVEEKGEGVPKAEVSLRKSGASGAVLKEQVTDGDGIAGFGTFPDGNYALMVKKKDFVSKTMPIALNFSRDGMNREVLVDISKEPFLEVEVRDTSGEPLSEVEVSLFIQREFNAPGSLPLHISYTDAEGRVLYDDVDRDGSYVLLLKKADYLAQTVERTLYGEEDQHVSVVLEWNID